MYIFICFQIFGHVHESSYIAACMKPFLPNFRKQGADESSIYLVTEERLSDTQFSSYDFDFN